MSELFSIQISGWWATAQFVLTCCLVGGVLWILSKIELPDKDGE